MDPNEPLEPHEASKFTPDAALMETVEVPKVMLRRLGVALASVQAILDDEELMEPPQMQVNYDPSRM